jgi:hypothetical protein
VVSRSPSNVERIRHPWTVRHLVRLLLVLGGIAAGVALAWVLTPQGDTLTFDVGLARGAALGLVLGLAAAALVPTREAPTRVVRPRPSTFEAWKAEVDAEAEAAAAAAADALPAEPGTTADADVADADHGQVAPRTSADQATPTA